MKTKWQVQFLTIVLLFLSCKDMGSNERAAIFESKVVGQTWRLISIESIDGAMAIPREKTYVIKFVDKTTVMGIIICNVCRGSYEIDGNGSIRVSWGCTEMGCEYSFDTAFRSALRSNKAFDAGNGMFRIRYGDSRGLVFVPSIESCCP